jgi:hypothetical protein
MDVPRGIRYSMECGLEYRIPRSRGCNWEDERRARKVAFGSIVTILEAVICTAPVPI